MEYRAFLSPADPHAQQESIRRKDQRFCEHLRKGSVLAPVDALAAEVGTHVGNEHLAFRDGLIGELVELKALNCLVVAVMKIFSRRVNVPFRMLDESLEIVPLVPPNFVGFAVLSGFCDRQVCPIPRGKEVSGGPLLKPQEVVAYG